MTSYLLVNIRPGIQTQGVGLQKSETKCLTLYVLFPIHLKYIYIFISIIYTIFIFIVNILIKHVSFMVISSFILFFQIKGI